MFPKMHVLDPDKQLFDWISFDGASNVQKADSLIEQPFPCCTESVGVEHTVSLLFGKIMAIRPMKELCGFAKKVGCQVCMYTLEVAHSNILFLPRFSSGKSLVQCDMYHVQSSERSVKCTTMVRRFCSLSLQSAGWVERPSNC